MCRYIVKDKETLETHLFICEMYVCENCGLKFKTLSNLKVHVVDNHQQDNVTIYYSKQERSNQEEFTERSYRKADLFSDVI